MEVPIQNGTFQIQGIKWDLEPCAGLLEKPREENRSPERRYTGTTPCLPETRFLVTNTKALNQRLITLRTTIFQVLDQLSPPGDHGEQPTARVMIQFICPEMFR